jgi:hypothetical protein
MRPFTSENIKDMETIRAAKTLINDHLKKWNLYVRHLIFSDIAQLKRGGTVDSYASRICGEKDADLGNLLLDKLEQIKDECKDCGDEIDLKPIVVIKEAGDSKAFDTELSLAAWSEKIYIFVGLHNEDILSFSSTIYNYDDVKNSLYFDASCTDQTNSCGKSLNYFIRIYSILELLENNENVEFIWGCMAGADLVKLQRIHESRGCEIHGPKYGQDKRGSCNQYRCDIVVFLNKFFSKLNGYKWDGC